MWRRGARMNLTLQDAGIVIALTLTLLGWAYQLGRGDARLARNEKDISKVEESITTLNTERAQTERDAREKMSEGFDKMYKKLDDLPCHNPHWNKDGC
jgi:hypothetical protein